jgi:predicted nucleotidyltransferase
MQPGEVIAILRRTLADEPHLRWAYLFGSAVRDARHRDVDVAVMPAPSMPAGGVAWGQIVARLEDAVQAKVDLVDMQTRHLPLVGPMLEERVVVLDRVPAARHAWEAETTSRWLDFRPAYARAIRTRTLTLQRRLGSPLMVERENIAGRLALLQDSLPTCAAIARAPTGRRCRQIATGSTWSCMRCTWRRSLPSASHCTRLPMPSSQRQRPTRKRSNGWLRRAASIARWRRD